MSPLNRWMRAWKPMHGVYGFQNQSTTSPRIDLVSFGESLVPSPSVPDQHFRVLIDTINPRHSLGRLHRPVDLTRRQLLGVVEPPRQRLDQHLVFLRVDLHEPRAVALAGTLERRQEPLPPAVPVLGTGLEPPTQPVLDHLGDRQLARDAGLVQAGRVAYVPELEPRHGALAESCPGATDPPPPP